MSTRSAQALVRRIAKAQGADIVRLGVNATNVMQPVLLRAWREALRRFLREHHAGHGSSFTAFHYQSLILLLAQALREINPAIVSQLDASMRFTAARSLHHMEMTIRSLDAQFGAVPLMPNLDVAAIVSSVVPGVAGSLLEVHKASLNNYGAAVIGRAKEEMAVGLALNLNLPQMVDRLGNVIQAERWRLERIARTETAYAYSSARAAAYGEFKKVLPDLLMRWTEMVDDVTGQPIDNRVYPDSLAMHGQLVTPGGLFTMPYGALNVSPKRWGRQWSHPPNRPNDRSHLMPWRPRWARAVPSWFWTPQGRKPAGVEGVSLLTR